MTDIDLSTVLAKSKEFEFLVVSHDPAYNDMVEAINLVKEFIIQHKLIIYGGTAIDYALRLKGDNIYPDDLLKVPDLDFFSPQNVEHAYQLADILHQKGYKEVRAITAQHMETMRVDLIDNHWIADITYRPQEIFDKLPYLVYNGMRILHPDFQRIDMHSALSFPYDNPPREVIFERWSKDIKRFNKLAKLYPIILPNISQVSIRQITAKNIKKYVLTGFAAYALLYKEFVNEIKNAGKEIPGTIIPANIEIGVDYITFDGLSKCEIIHYDLKKIVKDLGITAKFYEPYINLIPERVECDDLTIYSTNHKLVSVSSIKTSEGRIRVTNVQYLLKFFLSKYFQESSSPKIASVYIARYVSLLDMIKNMAQDSILMPSVQTYGNDNINLARDVALNRLYNDLEGTPLYSIPPNYYPERNAIRNLPHPRFSIDEIPFFHESGKLIEDINKL